MSIERELAEAFKRNDSALECPPSLDIRIAAEYRRVRVDKRGNRHMKKKWSFPKAVIVAMVVALICGFGYAGTKFLFADSQGKYSVRFQSSQAIDLDSNALSSARASLAAVQSQLAPGETAVVYLPELFAKFKGIPLAIGVTNSEFVSDVQQWRGLLEQQGVAETLPDSLLEGEYSFAGGTTNSPFHFVMGLDALDLLKDMKEEYKQSGGQELLWRLSDVPKDGAVSPYSSLYRNADGESIYLTWEIVGDTSIKVEGLTAPSTVYEEIDLNGRKAHFTKNTQSLYGESAVLQNIMWVEENSGDTVVFYVESDSASMSKERLIAAAASVQ